MSDQDRIFPYTTNTISSKQVMRIKENINQGIIGWFNTKFSKLTPEKLYGYQWEKLLNEILRVKGLTSSYGSSYFDRNKSS